MVGLAERRPTWRRADYRLPWDALACRRQKRPRTLRSVAEVALQRIHLPPGDDDDAAAGQRLLPNWPKRQPVCAAELAVLGQHLQPAEALQHQQLGLV